MAIVSIVIPVFDMEPFIDRCISSVVDQTYRDLEIVIIDDGSTDRSLEICKEWENRDSRIRIFHQDNKGVSSARIKGIAESTGDFITFIDSDDWIDDTYVGTAVEAFLQNSDIDVVIEGMQQETMDGRSFRFGVIGRDHLYSAEEAGQELFRYSFFTWGISGKFYKRRLLDAIKLDDHITIGEDLDWNWRLLHRAKKVFYTCKSDYHYVMNGNSAMHEQDSVMENSMEVFDRILNSCDQCSYYIRVYIERLEILLMARKIRAMYLRDPHRYENDIDALCSRFKEYSEIYPDVMNGHRELEKLLISDKSERDDFFIKEYRNILHAAQMASSYEKIYIYGTGLAAECILKIMSEDTNEKVSFIVSDSRFTESLFWKRKVWKLSDVVPDENSVIIVSVQNKLRTEIIEELRNRGHENTIATNLTGFMYRVINT